MDEQVRDRTPDSGHAAKPASTVSAREAAAALGLNERTIRRAIARGDLPAAKRAGVYWIAPADLARYRARIRLPAPSRVRSLPSPPRLIPLPTRASETVSALPTPLTALIGRERELQVVADLLHRDGVRLVTLTGPGGVGKTRLALRVAHDLVDVFAAGVRFVPLAAVPDAALVPASIAGALGLRERGGRTLRDTLVAALRERETLLLLDNLEHLLAATHLLTDLLNHCPRLRILVTSRTLLRVAGEHALPVPPLALPDADTETSLEELAATAAVRLFTERASAVDPAFVLSETTASLVAGICRRLDGLPLAIELAAARVTHLPLVALRERLERRLPLLSGGGDRPDRHRTLYNTIAWSHDLLTPDERALFRRLAVFPGGCTLDAAEAVSVETASSWGGRQAGKAASGSHDSRLSTLDSVAALVDASLLRQEADPDGTPRYRMLETVREFVEERLAASDEAASVRGAHAAHFLSFAARHELAELLPDGDQAVARLEAEHANLRAALAWLEEAGEHGSFLRLAADLGCFWAGRSHYQEGQSWLERALARDPDGQTAERARAIVNLGWIELYQGSIESAESHLAEGLAACHARDDAFQTSMALLGLAAAAILRGDSDQGAALLEEILIVARSVPDQRLAEIQAGSALINLAVVARTRGDHARAVELLEDSLHRMRTAGFGRGMIMALGDLGDLARDQDDHARALALYRESLELVRGKPRSREFTDVVEAVGIVAVAVGQTERAAELLGAANALREWIGLRVRVAENQAALDRAVAAARVALGSEEFAAAWAAGRKLHPGQAFAAALELTSTVPAASPRGPLSPRELDVLRLLVAGLPDRAIAAELFLSARTVENHVAHIFAKLGVRTRTGAVRAAIAAGYVAAGLPPDA